MKENLRKKRTYAKREFTQNENLRKKKAYTKRKLTQKKAYSH
jgi:hypothetical protein